LAGGNIFAEARPDKPRRNKPASGNKPVRVGVVVMRLKTARRWFGGISGLQVPVEVSLKTDILCKVFHKCRLLY
jgi:hypothetical protein